MLLRAKSDYGFRDFFKSGHAGLFFRFLKLIFPYKAKWLVILAASGIIALLGLVNPYLTKLFIDKAVGNKDMRSFFIIAALAGAVFIITGALNGFQQYLNRYVRARVRFDLNKKTFNCLSRLSLGWFRDGSTGANLYKISYDIGRIEDLITTVPPQVVTLFLKLPLILCVIFYLNWKMAVFTLCLTPFLYLPSYYFTKKRREIWERLIKNSEGIFKTLQEFFSHIYFIKMFGRESNAARNYLKKLAENIRIELSGARLEIFNSFIAKGLDKTIIGFISFYGGYQVIKGRMSLGSFTAIMVYLGQLVVMQTSFVNFFQTIAIGLVSCQRIAGILDEKNGIFEKQRAVEAVFTKGAVAFNKVSFGYAENRPVLKNLTFSVEGHKYICLASRSGAGKTTLLNLIMRLYEPREGEIFIDGIDISAMKLKNLKAQIGAALQEPFLFNDTVRNNILYGKENAGETEMAEAAELSLVYDFVKNLPNKYETVIGENACKLSEGQKQKIAIARALIKKPKILILDEAMSSMDTVSEEKILSNIRENFKGVTVIAVSHRLSTVMAADIVCFLKGPGEIVADRGENLFRNDKDFYDLFKEQLIKPTIRIQSQG
jgi:ATP-binding cassette, subfamily B, bacterial